MNTPKVSQCFGHTPFSAAYYRSGVHNGLDMYNDQNTLIKAVESGNAYSYRGGQAKGNGVFIFHENGKMTLYWHLQ
jgi:murein DD-endopeptidase MepM/ murein hydrolase activator NlpD